MKRQIKVKKIDFGNKKHTTDQKMRVSVLLRLFISSNATLLTPSSVFSGKNKKNIIIFSSAELAQRVMAVN